MKKTQPHSRTSRGSYSRLELDGGNAFVRDYRRGRVRIADGDVEAFAEEFVAAATSNDAIAELARDEISQEESGSALSELCFADE